MSFCFFYVVFGVVRSFFQIFFCLCYVFVCVFWRRPSSHFRFSVLLCVFDHREIEIKYYKK